MARLVIQVDGSFSGPNVLRDPRLVDGSLLLVEPGHPITPWDSAANPALIPNIAAEQLADVLGSSTGTAALAVTSDMSESTGIVERTAKGGLHFLIKQSGTVGNEDWYAAMSSELADYIADNDDHSYFVSLWARITRRVGEGYSSVYAMAGILSTTIGTARLGFNQAVSSGNISTTPASDILGRTTGSLTDGLGLFRVDLADDSVTTPISPRFFHGGNVNATTDSAPSWILYAAYLEDLTVSGRTYSEASAADAEAYATAFGTGGRYAGDSWTAPD